MDPPARLGLAAQRTTESNVSAKDGGSAAGAGPPVGAVEELVKHRALAGTQGGTHLTPGVLGGTHRSRGYSQYSQVLTVRGRAHPSAPSKSLCSTEHSDDTSEPAGRALRDGWVGTPGVLPEYSMGTLWVQRGTPVVPPPGVPPEYQWSTPEYSRGVPFSSTHAPASATERREKSSSSGCFSNVPL